MRRGGPENIECDAPDLGIPKLRVDVNIPRKPSKPRLAPSMSAAGCWSRAQAARGCMASLRSGWSEFGGEAYGSARLRALTAKEICPSDGEGRVAESQQRDVGWPRRFGSEG